MITEKQCTVTVEQRDKTAMFYITFRKASVVRTSKAESAEVLIDYDADDNPVGMEILLGCST